MKQIAVVTGGNRGIGLEVARQLTQDKERLVIVTVRDAAKGETAATRINSPHANVRSAIVDVTNDTDVRQFSKFLEHEFGRVDILVNNAGIFIDERAGASAFDTPVEILRQTAETNVYGAYRMCQTLIPLMKKNGYGRVVNVSSGMGQLSEMNGLFPGYRISKTALNAVTRIFHDETAGSAPGQRDILINSACPGWVKTDMGGPGADRSVSEGADTIVWLATLGKDGPSGGFFRDRELISW